MSKISVTFTGADNRTLCDDLTTIIDAARDLAVPVEFGLLCSTKRAGDERYPGGHAARHLLQICRGEGVPVAVHLCGAAARAMLFDGWRKPDVFGSREWHDVVIEVGATGRVQINLSHEGSKVANLNTAQCNLHKLVARAGWPSTGTVIGQYRVGAWPVTNAKLVWLLDRSGGRGTPVSLDDVPTLPSFPVGIAGGLGPDDPELLRGIVTRLLRSTHGGWIDMESQIRTDGKLDPAKCVDVLQQVAQVRDELET